MSDEQKHQYHLVEPSPWPALGSLLVLRFFWDLHYLCMNTLTQYGF